MEFDPAMSLTPHFNDPQPTPLDRTCQPRISIDYVRILVGRPTGLNARRKLRVRCPGMMRSQFAVVGPWAKQNRRPVRLVAMLRAPYPTMCRMGYWQVLSTAASVARPNDDSIPIRTFVTTQSLGISVVNYGGLCGCERDRSTPIPDGLVLIH